MYRKEVLSGFNRHVKLRTAPAASQRGGLLGARVQKRMMGTEQQKKGANGSIRAIVAPTIKELHCC